MNKRDILTTTRLAKKNIQNKPLRSYAMMGLTGFLCFIIFLSSFIILSFKNGMDSLANRMGADIIVVPEGYDSNISSAILRGEPNTFFLDASVADRLKDIEGVKLVSPQFYLATLSAGCCAYPIQIIGIDLGTDFTTLAWLNEQTDTELVDNEIIVGFNIVGQYNSSVKFFNQQFKIKGRLAKTGMGFDNTVFMSMERVRELAVEYEKILDLPITDMENSISCVMIRIDTNTNVKDVVNAIRIAFAGEGVYALSTTQMMSEVSTNMMHMIVYIYVLMGLVWVLAFVILCVVYSFSIRERSRELATLRILGATKSKLKQICLMESFMINATGAGIGVILAMGIAVLFAPAFSTVMGLPFLAPDYLHVAVLVFAVLALGIVMGPVATLFSVVKMDKTEPALLLKLNE